MDAVETEVVVHATGKRLPIVMTDRRENPIGRSTLEFTANPKDPSGVYSFWTVMRGNIPCFNVRTFPGRTAENRLNEGWSLGEQLVNILNNVADMVKPSTAGEIRQWLDGHPDDAQYALMDTLSAPEDRHQRGPWNE